MRRPHLAIIAYIILAIGVSASLWLQANNQHQICTGLNNVRAEAQAFVVKLAPDTPIPKGAGAPLTATIKHSNAVKAKVRAQARDSFKIVNCP